MKLHALNCPIIKNSSKHTIHFLSSFIFILITQLSFSQINDPVVLAYFPSWSETWTSPSNNSKMREIPAYVNHVFLSFAKPDLAYVQGSYDISNTGIQTPYDGCTLKESVKVLNDKGVKVILSIGGETYWNTPNAYNIDYQQIKDLVDDMGFAGIDWDYEPNGSFSGIGTATNVQHFIDFITYSRALMPKSAGYIIACAPSGVGALGGSTNDDPSSPFAYGNRNSLTGESDANLYNATVPTNGINMFGFTATGHMTPVFAAVGDDIDLVAYQGYNLGASTNRTLMYDAYAYYAEIHGFKVAAGVHYPNEPWGPYYTYTHSNIASLSSHIVNDPNRTGDGDGIMIWQLLLTGGSSSAYSYMHVASDVLNGDTETNAIANANNFSMETYSGGSEVSCFCTAPQPSLGSNQSICGVPSITLNSGVSPQAGVTFTWIHDGNTLISSSTTQNTYNIVQPGTYTVEVEESGCTNTDVIVISNNIPTFSLGADVNICPSLNAPLNTGFTDTSFNFVWTQNGNVISGEINSSYIANSAGTYEVTVSASGCTLTSDIIVVTDNLPVFDLGSSTNLCSPTTTTLNTGFTNTTYNYVWTLNGAIIPGAIGTSYTASSAGTYEVTVSATGCSSGSDNVIVTSTLPEFTNDTICAPGVVNLSVNENVEWYDAPTGGTLLNTGMTYSPTISTNTGYWVSATGSVQSYTTMRSAFQGDGWQQASNIYGTKMTVYQDLTLDEVTVDAGGGSAVINIVASDGVTVVATKSFVSITGLSVLQLGFTLTPGTYYLNTVGSISNIYVDITPSTDYNNPGVLLVKGEAYWDWGSPSGGNYVLSGDYGTFINLKYTTGSSCDRVLIEGIIDPANSACGGCSGSTTYSTDTQTTCGPYTWIDGNIYTTTNNTATFNIVGGSINGCDSIVTLNLTIANNATGTDSQTTCGPYTWIDGNIYTTTNNTATFNIVGGSINGCDSIVTLNLTINTVETSVTINDPVISANSSGLSYQWLYCPSMTPISGATSQSYTATLNESYAVIVSNNICSDTSACYAVIGVGIIENDFGSGILLYPNPTDGDFSIDLGENSQLVTVTMTDLSGKVIQSKTYNDEQLLSLKIEEPAGVYLLVIESGNKKAVIRLVKE
jgi:chitinase